MKNLKHLMTALLVLTLVVCLTSCLKIDLDVEIKKNNTATTTTKISIEKDVYELLMETGESDFDLEGFTPDAEDEKYYSKVETKKYKTLEELTAGLLEMEVSDGIPLFSSVKIEHANNKTYFFEVKTNDGKSGNANEFISNDSLALIMTVKLPGEVIPEDVVGGEMLEDGSVLFIADDFVESNTFAVSSETKGSPLTTTILIGTVGLSVIAAVVIVIRFRNVKKTKKATDAEMENMLGNQTNNESLFGE